jgi:cysteinyl-tRNA synthetase
MASVHELGVLTHQEKAHLSDLYTRWLSARDSKSWVEADALRSELVSAGVDLEEGSWHPVFESPSGRSARYAAREAHA